MSRITRPLFYLLLAFAIWCGNSQFGQAQDLPTAAAKVFQLSGKSGGLLVHVGCGDGQLTSELSAKPTFLVHGLLQQSSELAAARKTVATSGRYGEASVDTWDGVRLPYGESMVSVLLLDNDSANLDEAEAFRVVAPEGVILRRQESGAWSKTIKPRPENIDEWTHYLHDSTGNAVAQDQVVGPPRRLQWIGSPRWSRHHDRMASMSALVSSSNRLFYIMDEGSRISIQLPSKWSLIARDAFNGVILWKKPIPTWHNHLWP